MAYTRKQAVTGLSVVFLLIALGIAGYAYSRVNSMSLPISDVLTGLTTALPLVAGILLECGYDLTRHQERRQQLGRGDIQRPPLVTIANTIIFIYSTAVMTLLGTHAAPPSGLDCGLRNRWQTLFKQKDSGAIQKIQDAFNCCGLANTRDMPWPFPDKGHVPQTCETRFDRTKSCLKPWKAEEQRVSGLLMVVVGMVFLWQFLIMAIPTQRDSWFHRFLPNRISRIIADEEHVSGGPQRTIDYLPHFGRYSDRVEEETDSNEGVTHSRTIEGVTHSRTTGGVTHSRTIGGVTHSRTIEGGVYPINGALPDNAQRDRQPTAENEWAA